MPLLLNRLSSMSRSTTTLTILYCASVIAALTALRIILPKGSKSKDHRKIEEIYQKGKMKSEDIVYIFESLFASIKAILAFISGQIPQIFALVKMIPEAHL